MCPVCGAHTLETVVSNMYFVHCRNCLAKWDIRTGRMHRGPVPDGPAYDPLTYDDLVSELEPRGEI